MVKKALVGVALFVAALFCLTACDDAALAKKTLDSAGFSDISITGWEPFACGKDDMLETGFIAKNPNGKTVTGVVCCGFLFKACTIRF